MKFKNNFFIDVLLIYSFVLFGYEGSGKTNDNSSYDMQYVHIDSCQHRQAPSSWSFSCDVKTVPNSYDYQANYSVIANNASPALQHYFAHTVMPLMYHATTQGYYYVLPGYAFDDGLRYCKNQLSQFSSSDAALISGLTHRLETYCARIETILFKKDMFCDALCRDDQIKLINVYADFLKEFYARDARYIFLDQSKTSSLMQRVMREIDWNHYDGRDAKSSIKQLQQRQAASANGNLGKVYKALHEGNSEKAYIIGNERVTTAIGKKQIVTSVFERYPELRQKVEQIYKTDKAKAEQVRIAQQAAIKRDAEKVQKHYQEQKEEALFAKHPDLLKDRCNATTIQFHDPRLFEKLHKVLAEHIVHINPQHLTADQKGILCTGGHLQHHLVDEAISVVDVAISGDLVENMQDAVIELANTSLQLNKENDVIMASRTLDACWALLDHAHNAAKCAYATIITHAPLVAKGMADGVRESLHGAIHAVCHPIEAIQDVAQSLAVAGYYLGKITYSVCVFDAACDLLEADPEHFEQKIREHLIDPDAFITIYEHAKNNISTEDVARVGTKTAVDMMLLHGATKAVSAIAKECWPALISCMRKGEQSAEVALTAENIPVQCGEEIASVTQKMESLQKTGGSKAIQEDIVQKIRNVGDDILDVMEKAGGHTLERHVAQTYDELFLRSLKIDAEAVTAFTNKRVAIKAVKESLRSHAEKISLWLSNSLEDQMVLELSHLHSIGKGITKGKRNLVYDLTNSRIVLKKDIAHELGFKIITAFPIV